MYVLGVRVDNVSRQTALGLIQNFAARENGRPARKVFFTNVHSIHMARRDGLLRDCINDADLVLPDGSGLKLAGRLLSGTDVNNLNGTDFTPEVLRRAEACGQSVFLLGAKPQVIQSCLRRLMERYPDLRVAGYHHGHFRDEEEAGILLEINRQQPNILLVALGTPLQEKWIARYAQQLKVGVCLAVGGLFDFMSGERNRAPVWVRRMGIEWLFRFIQDPKAKWRRVFIEIPWFLTVLFARSISSGRERELLQRKADR
jgi:N-acetylglucosaminyldiphosphoundecaprenol N-acetyl-beta-D-mannosaminyltransferase